MSRFEEADRLDAIVTFHGLLHSRPTMEIKPGSPRMSPAEYAEKVAVPSSYGHAGLTRVLIENGDIDQEVPEESVADFKREMDEQGVDWRINNHSRTPHGFALAPGVWSTKYTEAADRRSTISMLSLFAEVWPTHPQFPVEENACGTRLGQYVLPAAMARL